MIKQLEIRTPDTFTLGQLRELLRAADQLQFPDDAGVTLFGEPCREEDGDDVIRIEDES